MPARKPRVPQLRPKRVRDHVYAVAKFNRRELSFGRWDDPGSVREFHAYLLRWESNGRRPTDRSAVTQSFTIRDLAQRFMEHAAVHYRNREGTPTREALNFKHALARLLAECGDEPVERSMPLASKPCASRCWCRRIGVRRGSLGTQSTPASPGSSTSSDGAAANDSCRRPSCRTSPETWWFRSTRSMVAPKRRAPERSYPGAN